MEDIRCLILILVMTCVGSSRGHDLTTNDGTDVVNITSVEATGRKKLEITWELQSGTENADEFMIQLEACPGSGLCHQEYQKYIPLSRRESLFTQEIECEECLHYIIRITAVDFERNCLGDAAFWASFEDVNKDLSDSSKTLASNAEPPVVGEELQPTIALPSSLGPAIGRVRPHPTEQRIGAETEEQGSKNLIIYASLGTGLGVLLAILVAVIVLLRRQRTQRDPYDCEQGANSGINPDENLGRNHLKLRVSLLPEEEGHQGFAHRVDHPQSRSHLYSMSDPHSP